MRQGRAETMRESIPSRLRAVSIELDIGLDLQKLDNITWTKIKSQTLNRLCHTRAHRIGALLMLLIMSSNTLSCLSSFSAIGYV